MRFSKVGYRFRVRRSSLMFMVVYFIGFVIFFGRYFLRMLFSILLLLRGMSGKRFIRFILMLSRYI